MRSRVSDYLRRSAAEMEPRRKALRNKVDINGDPIEEPDAENPARGDGDPVEAPGGPGAPRTTGQTEEHRTTAAPDIKAPRRKPSHRRKWNPDTRKPLMRGYMQEYRGTGRINERKPQTRGA